MHTTEVIFFRLTQEGEKKQDSEVRRMGEGAGAELRREQRLRIRERPSLRKGEKQHSETTKQRTICDNGSEWRNAYQKASSLEKIDQMPKDDDEHRIVTTRVSSNSKPDFRESKSLMVGV